MVLLKQVIQIHNQWRALFPIVKYPKINGQRAKTICNIGIICQLICNANNKTITKPIIIAILMFYTISIKYKYLPVGHVHTFFTCMTRCISYSQ